MYTLRKRDESLYRPDIFLLLFLGLVKLVDVGKLATVIMHPEHRAAVKPSSNKAVLCQEEAGEVGQIGVSECFNTEREERGKIMMWM